MTHLEQLLTRLPAEADAALITSGENRFYLSGMRSSAGVCLITREAAYFIIDFRYIEKARKTIRNFTVLLQDDLTAQLGEIIRRHNVRTVAVEEHSVTLAQRETLSAQLAPAVLAPEARLSGLLEQLRSIKTPEEVDCIRRAQAFTDAGFAHICQAIRPGMTEREIALELEFFMRRMGSEGASFDFIAVAGANSSLPHGVPGDYQVAEGDFLTMDFGGVYGGYRSDMTRTVAIGQPDEEQLRVYDTVLQAQQAVLDAIRPGMTGKQVDAIARDLIYGAGYEGCFGHGLGHSLGLEIHEPPNCNLRDETVLQAGMMMTVEPGIYLEGRFGVRIEDMVLLTADGCEDLTHSPRELICL